MNIGQLKKAIENLPDDLAVTVWTYESLGLGTTSTDDDFALLESDGDGKEFVLLTSNLDDGDLEFVEMRRFTI